MYQDVLQRIGGADGFAVVSLLIFVLVFTGAIVQACRLDRGRAERLAALPMDLDDDKGDRA